MSLNIILIMKSLSIIEELLAVSIRLCYTQILQGCFSLSIFLIIYTCTNCDAHCFVLGTRTIFVLL